MYDHFLVHKFLNLFRIHFKSQTDVFWKKLAQLKRFNKILRNFFYYLKNNEKANEKKKLVAYIHMFFKQMTSYEYDFKQRNKIIFFINFFYVLFITIASKEIEKNGNVRNSISKISSEINKGLTITFNLNYRKKIIWN